MKGVAKRHAVDESDAGPAGRDNARDGRQRCVANVRPGIGEVRKRRLPRGQGKGGLQKNGEGLKMKAALR